MWLLLVKLAFPGKFEDKDIVTLLVLYFLQVEKQLLNGKKLLSIISQPSANRDDHVQVGVS